MLSIQGGARAKVILCCLFSVAALLATESSAQAETFEGPSFKRGMWHFVRTLDLIGQKTNRRIMEREMTRCVDPTHAMKATFSSGSVGSCVSSKPNHTDNRYTFANRCDFMGRVSTVITVYSEESYTELNELTQGTLPRKELVVAHRIGDCPAEAEAPSPAGNQTASALAH
jgi:hypothetical protein